MILLLHSFCAAKAEPMENRSRNHRTDILISTPRRKTKARRRFLAWTSNEILVRALAGTLLLLAYAISIWLGDDTIWRTIARFFGLP